MQEWWEMYHTKWRVQMWMYTAILWFDLWTWEKSLPLRSMFEWWNLCSNCRFCKLHMFCKIKHVSAKYFLQMQYISCKLQNLLCEMKNLLGPIYTHNSLEIIVKRMVFIPKSVVRQPLAILHFANCMLHFAKFVLHFAKVNFAFCKSYVACCNIRLQNVCALQIIFKIYVH